MKSLLRITDTIFLLLATFRLTNSIFCQTSMCVVNKNSEFNCRSTYLAVHVQCGSSDKVCVKELVFNSTLSRKSVESSQWVSVTRSPLLRVVRDCGKNLSGLSMGCYQAVSPPYEVRFCLCDSDYCNGTSVVQGSVILSLIGLGLVLIYSGEIVKESSIFSRL